VQDVGFLIVGLVLLYFGAEWLVAGAAGLARAAGMRPLIVGLTVVAFGTSAPELVVSISASLENQGALALGNVVGSNIANLGLILGMTALIMPPHVDRQVLRREVPVLLAVTSLVPLTLIDGTLERWESVALIATAIGYTAWMVRSARVGSVSDAANIESAAEQAAGVPHTLSRGAMVLRLVVGLAFLVGGGKLLVDGAVGIARLAGMSEHTIGLTIVAVGTSLPELATSLIAASRGHSDIAVGNVIGSNIFNVLLIAGTAGAISPIDASLGALAVDMVALGGLTAFGCVAMVTGRRVGRFEGAVLILGYVAFVIALLV